MVSTYAIISYILHNNMSNCWVPKRKRKKKKHEDLNTEANFTVRRCLFGRLFAGQTKVCEGYSHILYLATYQSHASYAHFLWILFAFFCGMLLVSARSSHLRVHFLGPKEATWVLPASQHNFAVIQREQNPKHLQSKSDQRLLSLQFISSTGDSPVCPRISPHPLSPARKEVPPPDLPQAWPGWCTSPRCRTCRLFEHISLWRKDCKADTAASSPTPPSSSPW